MDLNTEIAGISEAHSIASEVPSDLVLYSQNWIWRAVECLIESPEFHPSPKWSAQRLNVSLEKIVDAFDGLERLGFIKRSDSSFQKVKREYHYGTQEYSAIELLQNHGRISQQIISKLNSDSKYTSWFMLADDELLTKFAPRFQGLFKEMFAEGISKGCKEVVSSTLSFAKLTESDIKGSPQ